MKQLGEMSQYLSGRDISDICKDAERKWASKFIRKEVSQIVPEFAVYKEATLQRINQIKDSNLRMENEVPSYMQRHGVHFIPTVGDTATSQN